MSGNPSDICTTPIDVVIFIVKNVIIRACDADHITPCRMHNTLGFPRCSARIEDEKHILGVHWFRRAILGSYFHGFVIPNVTLLLHINLVTCALNDDNVVNTFKTLNCGIRVFLQGYDAASTKTAV
ncbi:hypothetical protein SDC9_183904 [bioreactor metagenome]|uniref:Uncharacterized protein n=1 Tax=bioreactor metagenome TaxID=1076179 RepID=A0A645HBJ1_9ZZZZ